MKKQLRQLRVDLTSTKENSRDKVDKKGGREMPHYEIIQTSEWINAGTGESEILWRCGHCHRTALAAERACWRETGDGGASGKRIALMQGDHIVGNSLGSYASQGIGD